RHGPERDRQVHALQDPQRQGARPRGPVLEPGLVATRALPVDLGGCPKTPRARLAADLRGCGVLGRRNSLRLFPPPASLPRLDPALASRTRGASRQPLKPGAQLVRRTVTFLVTEFPPRSRAITEIFA